MRRRTWTAELSHVGFTRLKSERGSLTSVQRAHMRYFQIYTTYATTCSSAASSPGCQQHLPHWAPSQALHRTITPAAIFWLSLSLFAFTALNVPKKNINKRHKGESGTSSGKEHPNASITNMLTNSTGLVSIKLTYKSRLEVPLVPNHCVLNVTAAWNFRQKLNAVPEDI